VPRGGYHRAVRPPTLRKITTIAWFAALVLTMPAVSAYVDGLAHDQSYNSMFPHILSTFLTLGAPAWPIALFAGAILLRRTRPELAPADARYGSQRRLAMLACAAGVVASAITVTGLMLWPGRRDLAWYGTTTGSLAAFAVLAVLIAAAVRFRERRVSFSLWTDQRALLSHFSGSGGPGTDRALGIYYGKGPGAPTSA
jgi:hypothetical protein